jgi:hypothetical protein
MQQRPSEKLTKRVRHGVAILVLAGLQVNVAMI